MAEIFKFVSSKLQNYQAEKIGLKYSSALQKLQEVQSETSIPNETQLDGVLSAMKEFQSAEKKAAGLTLDKGTQILRDFTGAKLETEMKKRLLSAADSPDETATFHLANKAAEHGVSSQLQAASADVLAAGKNGPVQKTTEMSSVTRNITKLAALHQSCRLSGSTIDDVKQNLTFDAKVREALHPENLKKTTDRIDYKNSSQDFAIQLHRDRLSHDGVFASKAKDASPAEATQDKKTENVFVGAESTGAGKKTPQPKPAQLR